MDLRALANPFPPSDVEWRMQQAGEKNGKVWARVLAYITNRAIMQRLDDVCGPENWRNEYRHEANGAVMCGISIFIHKPDFDNNGGWVTKWDGAENTDIEAVKGGLSSAMKRAAVQWGIGRYLYELEEGFAVVSENGSNYAGKKEGKHPAFKWDPPSLPTWALPGGSGKPGQTAAPVRGIKELDSAPLPRNPPAQEPSAKKRDEDKLAGGKRLGDYSNDELKKILSEKTGNEFVTLRKSISSVLANRAL